MRSKTTSGKTVDEGDYREEEQVKLRGFGKKKL